MSATITDEQCAARELVGTGPRARCPMRPCGIWRTPLRMPGDPYSADSRTWDSSVWPWPRMPAAPEGSVEDLCAMIEEAAGALVPGPIVATALATLVVDADGCRRGAGSFVADVG